MEDFHKIQPLNTTVESFEAPTALVAMALSPPKCVIRSADFLHNGDDEPRTPEAVQLALDVVTSWILESKQRADLLGIYNVRCEPIVVKGDDA